MPKRYYNEELIGRVKAIKAQVADKSYPQGYIMHCLAPNGCKSTTYGCTGWMCRYKESCIQEKSQGEK